MKLSRSATLSRLNPWAPQAKPEPLSRAQILSQLPRARARAVALALVLGLTVLNIVLLEWSWLSVFARRLANRVRSLFREDELHFAWPKGWLWIARVESALGSFAISRGRVDGLTALLLFVLVAGLLVLLVVLCRLSSSSSAGRSRAASGSAVDEAKGGQLKQPTMLSRRLTLNGLNGIRDLRNRRPAALPPRMSATKSERVVDYAIQASAEKLLRQTGRAVVELALGDEDLPRWLEPSARRVTTWLWAEVESEILTSAVIESSYASRLTRVAELIALERRKERLPWCPRPLRKLRAAILYTLYPYDRSFWGNLRSPSWFLLVAILLVPVYAVSPLMFAVLFVLRDKSDEFQLCQFILEFKGFQFVTNGCLAAFFGGLQLQHCAVNSSCAIEGFSGAPGNQGRIEFDLENAAFALNVGLVWTAFLLLPLSHRKGEIGNALARVQAREEAAAPKQEQPIDSRLTDWRASASRSIRLSSRTGTAATRSGTRGGVQAVSPADTSEHEAAGTAWCRGCTPKQWNQRRGGALRLLLLYDLVCFLLALTLALYMYFTTEGWATKSWIYWCRVIYGLSAFPFSIFVIPPIDQILLHLKPTAYDERGRCVAPLSMSDRQTIRKLQLGQIAVQSDDPLTQV